MLSQLSFLKEELSSLVEIGGTTYRRTSDGTCYHEETPGGVVNCLESARRVRTRLLIVLGNVQTGEVWDADRCYVGRSTGLAKIPLVIHRSNSLGGGALLDHCVVAIRRSDAHRWPEWWYIHPKIDRTSLEMAIQDKSLYIRG